MTRRSGRTTAQIQKAPPNAIYIWPTGNLSYPNELARHLGRTDLVIKSMGSLHRGDSLRGLRVEVILDHACWEHATRPQREDLHAVNIHNQLLLNHRQAAHEA